MSAERSRWNSAGPRAASIVATVSGVANSPYRRLGLRQAPEPARPHGPVTVEVERRPLSVYAEALQ